MIKAILFDFDGTLADSACGITNTMKSMFKEMNRQIPSDADMRATIGLRLDLALQKLGNFTSEETITAVNTYKRIFIEKGYSEITLFDGVRETLLKLYDMGIRLAVVTSREAYSLESICKENGVWELFDAYTSGTDRLAPKPAPDMVLALLKKMSLKKADVLVVGDTTFDIEMGNNAECQTIAVTYGNHSVQTLESAHPTYIIDSFDQLLGIVKSINTPQPVLNEHHKDEYAPAHTAEHLLNQTMIRMFGCKRSNNAHIERKKSKINYDLTMEPTVGQIAEIEHRMNSLIAEDLPVTYEFVTRDNIPDGVVLDKLPENASETLRIVRIGDYDICACVGKHVESTAEIRNFKITSSSYNNGSFRIVYKVNQ